MAQDEPNDDTIRPRVERIIAEYLEAEASGQPLNIAELLTAHPDLAGPLQSFFANHDWMKQASPGDSTDASDQKRTQLVSKQRSAMQDWGPRAFAPKS